MPSWIRTRDSSKGAAADIYLRALGHRDLRVIHNASAAILLLEL